jgi:hypothetical protein
VTPSGGLWAFAMLSRFIRPGAHRISSSGTISGVGYGAFKNTDDSIIVVFTNTGNSAQSVKIAFSGFTPSLANAYLTDNKNQVAPTVATISGSTVAVCIPAYAVVTIQMSGDGRANTTIETTSAKPRTTSTSVIGASSKVSITRVKPQSTYTKINTASSMAETTSSKAQSTQKKNKPTTENGGRPGTQNEYDWCGGRNWTN